MRLPYPHLVGEPLREALGWVVLGIDSPPLRRGHIERWSLTPHGIGNEVLNRGADVEGWALSGDEEDLCFLFVSLPRSDPYRRNLHAIWQQLRLGVVTDHQPYIELWCLFEGRPAPPKVDPEVVDSFNPWC